MGNNNAYCQDNEISWFDWGLLSRHEDIHRFTKLLIAARIMHGEGAVVDLSLNQLLDQARLEWHGVRLHSPDLSYVSHSIALTAWSGTRRVVFHYLINSYWKPLTFRLPSPRKMPGGIWRRWIDTSRVSPEDIVAWDMMPTIASRNYRLPARSIAVLIARSEII
jgi:glycogen operon protein